MTYKLLVNSNSILREDGVCIPDDPANVDFQTYRQWVSEGNTPEPVDSIAPEDVVTMRQARLALLQTGLLTQVNTAIADMPGTAGDMVRIEWEFSVAVERNRPLVQSLIGTLGITSSQLDELFKLAATL